MRTLSEAEILTLIDEEEVFEAELQDGSLRLKIDDYVPSVCTAVHDGHRLRDSLRKNCLLDENDRYYEEDPYTGEMIASLPITLVGCDSRYEYDLNRPLSLCVYKQAWGKTVWRRKPSAKHLQLSHEKHRCFYRVLDALIAKLQKKFGACILFDLHSYNYQRIEEATPTINLGTEQIDMDRWGSTIRHFRNGLAKIELPHIDTKVDINRAFLGRGYMIAHINSRFENTLVIPTEIKKVFMDELSGEPYPLVLNSLNEGMKLAITQTATYFAKRYTKERFNLQSHFLGSEIDPVLNKVDRELYRIARGVETLEYVNPVNASQERKRFFAKHANYQPEFRYKQLRIDPYLFRERLYRLPVDDIRDAGIQQLYRKVIDGFAEKIDLLVSIGTDQFLYNSMRYYGEPSEQDINNAQFLLYAPEVQCDEQELIDSAEMTTYLKAKAEEWNLTCKVEPSSRIVAAAMVSHAKKTLYVRKDAKVTQIELDALAHHELGVHMVTTLNAAKQPLKVLSLGLPSNTLTQEGLAILCEYLSGNMSLKRLKTLSLRVLAVKEMLRAGDFRHTWMYLHEEHSLNREEAFRLALRVHRGGGFTKDYLYLRGLKDALQLNQKSSIHGLFVGKTGFDYLPIINELIAREILNQPVHLPPCLKESHASHSVLDYLIGSIR